MLNIKTLHNRQPCAQFWPRKLRLAAGALNFAGALGAALLALDGGMSRTNAKRRLRPCWTRIWPCGR